MSEHIDRPGESGDGRVSASVVAQVNIADLHAQATQDGAYGTTRVPVYKLLVLVEAVEQLQDVHEFQCGCDEPGNASLCVAEPRACFEALQPFVAASVPQKGPNEG